VTAPADLKEYAASLVKQFGHRNGNPDWDIIVEMRDEGEELTDAEVDEVYGLRQTAEVAVTWPAPEDEATPADHLTAKASDRGFDSYPPIPSEYGGQARVRESSVASSPHVWLFAEAPADLNKRTGPMVEAPLHLTAENAKKLGEQLLAAVANHYQNEGGE